MTSKRTRTALGTVAAVAAICAIVPLGTASADAVADFYRGKTIKFVSGGSAGGGFSSVARLLAIHMAKRVPGQPKMIVEAIAGAGGARMMANAALQDGTALGAALPIAVNAPLLRKVKFNPAKFHWLGSTTAMTEVSTIWHKAPATTLDGAKNTQLIMATSSKLSSAYLIGCESRMAVMSAAWFVEFRQRLPWLLHVD